MTPADSALRLPSGLPGIIDVHVHFMPAEVLRAVWAYFDAAEDHYGRAWPIHYRTDDATRLATLKQLGVPRHTALNYAHRPGMAAWLNDWSADFAKANPQVLHSATFYPETGVERYVSKAINEGARVFKVHVQVGDFSVLDVRLATVWGTLAEAGLPVVLHAGSGPLDGPFTGPWPVAELLARHPRLPLIIAHFGMPEIAEFLDLADRYEQVRLDTTMVGTDYMNELMPVPDHLLPRIGELGRGGKVLFGSDFPNIPYPWQHQVTALQRWDLGDDWLRAVLWDSAAELFDLGVGTASH